MALPKLTVLHDGTFPANLTQIQELVAVDFATAGELGDVLPGSEALLAWDFLTPALGPAWHTATSLRWVHTASAGVDNVLTPELAASDVTLTNSRGVFDGAIAEYVLGLVLMFAKDLTGTWRRQRDRQWEHRDTEPVAGTSAAVVGVGPIGRAVARALRGMGMHVYGVGRRARSGDADFGEIAASSDLTTVLSQADYVVLVAPLTEETRGMVDATALAAMRPTARLINVGRGELVVEPDLEAALREQRIRGAALDVFAQEPLPPESPLWEMPNVLVSPHMAADVVGWRDALADLFLDNLRRWRAGEPLRNVVDKSAGYVRPA